MPNIYRACSLTWFQLKRVTRYPNPPSIFSIQSPYSKPTFQKQLRGAPKLDAQQDVSFSCVRSSWSWNTSLATSWSRSSKAMIPQTRTWVSFLNIPAPHNTAHGCICKNNYRHNCHTCIMYRHLSTYVHVRMRHREQTNSAGTNGHWSDPSGHTALARPRGHPTDLHGSRSAWPVASGTQWWICHQPTIGPTINQPLTNQ